MATLIIVGSAIAGLGLTGTLLGFGTAGIVAGSAAAATQAAIGNVAAGSVFSILTSLGMTGTFLTTTIGGALTTAIGAIVALV